ncbi:type II secretion system F family protein [Trinickia mobilis]|uniref:type II secretion system F family protein n=1 Tax=Trinickia mobilis TaxID=2816356 RepID=UPI001A8CE3CE|nr:type II secretion system F family protein [Trinickia mobilis]
MDMLISSSIAVGVVLVAALFVATVHKLARGVPRENRAFRDPLPPVVATLWPLVRFVDFHISRSFPKVVLRDVRGRLDETKVAFMMSESQFVSLCVSSSLVTFCAGLVPGLLLDVVWLPALLFAGALAAFYPLVWLRDIAKRNQRLLLKHLPIYLSLLTMAVEAGSNISGALETAVRKGPPGPLQREFEHVLRDVRSGISRAEALQRMAERTRMREIGKFASAVVLAERMGSGLAQTLRFQARQQLTQRFQRAEKQAMEAPVKLIFPLVLFIFPVTFIVLAFPIAMKFVGEGLL